MTVMIGRNGGWFLGFGDPAWNLGVGTDIPVSMTFDGQAPWSGTAHALTAQMVDVPMAENSALITAFRAAYQMQVYAEGRSFAFNLNGTSRLMVQLAHCVQTALAIERGVAPPHYAEAPERPLNPPAPPISTNGPPQDASFELEATRIASNLLLQANPPMPTCCRTPTHRRRFVVMVLHGFPTRASEPWKSSRQQPQRMLVKWRLNWSRATAQVVKVTSLLAGRTSFWMIR